MAPDYAAIVRSILPGNSSAEFKFSIECALKEAFECGFLAGYDAGFSKGKRSL